MKLTRARLLGIMIATTFVVAWAPALGFAIKGLDASGREGRALMMFQSFAPLVGALVGEAWLRKPGVVGSLGLSLDVSRMWLVAWVSPLLATVVGIGATWLLGTPPILTAHDLEEAKRALVAPENRAAFEAALRDAPIQSPGMILLMALPAGVTVNAIPMIAEEIGFRGFLYREMPGDYFARSMRIGLVHGVFLVPITLLGWGIEGAPLVASLLVVVRAVIYSFVAVYLRARCNSVIPVAIFGGTFLALVHPARDLTLGAPALLGPPYGLMGIVGLLVLLALAWLHDRYVATAKIMRTNQAGSNRAKP